MRSTILASVALTTLLASVPNVQQVLNQINVKR
jgi:hypothetical protein